MNLFTYLKTTPKKWWTRKLTDDLKKEIDHLIPSNIDYKEKMILLSNNILSPPICPVCNSQIKLTGSSYKKTCSTSCREKLKNNQSSLEKRKNTNLEKYGVENPAQLKEIQEKRIQTNKQKYGSGNSPLAIEKTRERAKTILQEKGKETLLEKYGVDNSSKIPGSYDKKKETLINNYGVDHYSKSEEFIEHRKSKYENYWKYFIPQHISFIGINDPSKELMDLYSNPNSRIEFICNNCNIQDEIATETMKYRIRNFGNCCSKCGNFDGNFSAKEKSVVEYVRSIYFGPILENKFSIIPPLELDIYLPELKIAIEFNGLFYHNDLRKPPQYHIDKTNKCLEKGIQLIHIFEDEWDYSKEIVKNRLKAKLGLETEKIFARKCTIKEIPHSLSSPFIEKYHIQGNAKSSIKLGLFYNNDLVSVMTFSYPNKMKGQKNVSNHWELLRYCSKTTVVGGPSKLFSYFRKNYNPEYIISFSDKRWNTGNLYEQLGMTYVGDTKLNYFYFLKDKRENRIGHRKTKDDDQELTEEMNRRKQGYLRIWDCGSKKYEWKKESSI